ncbi:MAG TPA: hypothetical protein VLM85_27085 [Polyangiaceae bacterium]|nr:hypothetical protein [Polyangiaceae bacterium]
MSEGRAPQEQTTKSRRALTLVISFLLCLVYVDVLTSSACSNNSAKSCTPGASVACAGPGGCSGAQVCSADGTSYGVCDCGDAANVPDSNVPDTSGDSADHPDAPIDTGLSDGPLPDGQADGGLPDAGLPDASTLPDASLPDAALLPDA